MKGKRRSPSEIARDRRLIANHYLRGKLQAEIAEEVKVSQSSVSRDLRAIQKQWIASSLIDFDQAKGRELAEIDHLERVYWRAWLRSCESRKAKSVKAKGAIQKEITNSDGAVMFVQESPAEQTVRTEERVGDPRFLQGVQWCIDRRCKIIGIDAPDRTEITGAKGGPIEQTITEIVVVRQEARDDGRDDSDS